MLALSLHPSETRKPRHKVRASARRVAGSDLLTLRFEIEGTDHVVWPEEVFTARTDDLWKETCLECFVGNSDARDPSYLEWNFSPNGRWAAYHFDGHRQGMKPASVPAPTVLRTSLSDRTRFEIDFGLGEEFERSVTGKFLALSLTAVIIEKNEPGAPFYWALHHAGTKPDFHLRESFTLELEN